jgi:hypothetical protein
LHFHPETFEPLPVPIFSVLGFLTNFLFASEPQAEQSAAWIVT